MVAAHLNALISGHKSVKAFMLKPSIYIHNFIRLHVIFITINFYNDYVTYLRRAHQ
jgi:hypothetical protein